jgi:hypothetical protein
MGHFTINLPENQKGVARWGIVCKMTHPFFRKNLPATTQGYIVNVSDTDGKTEYRLFRSVNDDWSRDPEGKLALDDETLITIMHAIVENENRCIPSHL